MQKFCFISFSFLSLASMSLFTLHMFSVMPQMNLSIFLYLYE